jgi:Domain of unknown function (DUF4386)
MTDMTTSGRWIGAALLAGYALDIGSNFFLQPMVRTGIGAMGLFGGAAAQPGLISAIVLIGLISGVVAIAAAALVCQLSLAKPFAWLAFMLLAIRAASFGMGGGELASYQLFRSLGDAMLATPTGALAGLADPISTLVTEQRDGLHFPQILLGGTGAFILYAIFLRSGWVPRWLAIAGLLATASQITGVFTGILNGGATFYFLVPLAVVQLVAGLWLVVRGFSVQAVQRSAMGPTGVPQ